MSGKPLQNGRHERIENGNVPVESPAEPQREQPPPAPEPELVEAAFLSPFSMPGEFWGSVGAPRVRARVFRMESRTREWGGRLVGRVDIKSLGEHLLSAELWVRAALGCRHCPGLGSLYARQPARWRLGKCQ